MKVLILHEKHDIRVIDATSEFEAARHVVQERLDSGQWYDTSDSAKAKIALGKFEEQPGLVKAFLLARSRVGAEYERVSFLDVERPE